MRIHCISTEFCLLTAKDRVRLLHECRPAWALLSIFALKKHFHLPQLNVLMTLMYFVEFCYLFTTMCNKFLLNIHFVFFFFGVCLCLAVHIVKPSSVAQLDAPSDWRPGGCGFNPRRGRQHSFLEIDHEIFSLPSADSRRTVISFWRKNVHNTG